MLQSMQEQTQSMLQQMQQQTQSMLQAMQQQTQATLQSNAQLLEVIKTQQTQSSFNWQPVVEGAFKSVAQALGGQASFPSSTISIPVSITPEFELLNAKVSKLESVLEATQTMQGQQGLMLEQLGKTLEQLGKTLEQLTQGFNTSTQIVAASTGSGSNDSGSTPPSVPSTPASSNPPSDGIPPAHKGLKDYKGVPINILTNSGEINKKPPPGTGGGDKPLSTEPAPQPITGNSTK